MVAIQRVHAVLSGGAVTGPSASVFFFDASTSTGAAAALRAFYNSMAGFFPSGMNIQVDGSGDVLESTNGNLTGSWAGTTPALVSGSGTGGFTAGVGCRVVWNTAGIHFGRRTRGSTFLVPIKRDALQNDGTIDDATIASINTACATLISSGTGFGIWSRPHAGASDGGFAAVTAGAVPDKVSWLRSRRT